MSNGSRLREHRQPKVSFESWFLLVALVSAMLILGPIAVKAQEYQPFHQTTGTIVAGAELCFSPDLSAPSVQLLNTWQRLVNELGVYERGGSRMHEEDANLGQLIYDNNLCGTVSGYYDIVIMQSNEGYVLATYADKYNYDAASFIVAKRDVIQKERI
jgi:hypothetical protein